jgi:hypothetical protein
MIKQIKFNDKYSYDDFGVVLSESSYSKPVPKMITETVPFKDGQWDFSRIDGKLHYENITLTFVFHIVEENAVDADNVLSEITSWLFSFYGNLYDEHFDDWHFASAACTGIEHEYLLPDRTAIKVTATFTASPYMVSNHGSTLRRM